jgi:hypothetical protein
MFINQKSLYTGKTIVMTRIELFKLIVDTSSELEEAKAEINNASAPRVTYSDIEDVSDRYQSALEYQWWLRDQTELIEHLQNRLDDLRAQMDNYEHKGYEFVIRKSL